MEMIVPQASWPWEGLVEGKRGGEGGGGTIVKGSPSPRVRFCSLGSKSMRSLWQREADLILTRISWGLIWGILTMSVWF